MSFPAGPQELLKTGSEQLGEHLGPAQLGRFNRFLEELLAANRKTNLVGASEPETVVVKHFLDSLSCLKSGKLAGSKRVVDMGGGAGFPGLVLKIARPALKLIVVDGSTKKTDFLTGVARAASIDVKIERARLEDYGRGPGRGRFDVGVARGLAALSVLAEYGLPLLAAGGVLVLQKGPRAPREVKEAGPALRELQGEVEAVQPVEVPFLEGGRFLVIVRKTGPTPARYPRRTGVPTKRPLR